MRLALPLLLLSCGAPPPATEEVPEVRTCDLQPAHGLRRLTALQYDRAIADLLGEPGLTWTAAFPPAPGGWEGLSEAQPVPETLVEAWSAAAEAVADHVMARGPRAQIFEAEAQGWPVGTPMALATDGGSSWWGIDQGPEPQTFPFVVPVQSGGLYTITVRAVWAAGWIFDGVGPELALQVDGELTAGQHLVGTFDQPDLLTWTVDLPAGDAAIGLQLAGVDSWTNQGIAVDHLRVEGPAGDPFATDGPTRLRLVRCDPAAIGDRACASEVLSELAPRAWRRPLQPAELDRLLRLVDLAAEEGDGFEVGLRLALRAMLLAPDFLFRHEDVSGLQPGQSRPATPLELASRLSLTLWASIPDDALLACAAAGQLGPGSEPCSLAAEVDRMLADPRADAFAVDFGRQWLSLDAVTSLQRDGERYPDVDAALLAAMADETYALLRRVGQQGDLLDLVDAPFSTDDARVAAIYGLQPGGTDPARLGLLGQASVLALTSHADRTSPVQRGKYVLDRLLCDPPEPPPPGVALLPAEVADADVVSALATHRQNPACASCHDAIDPPGLALEAYDAIGARRQAYPDGQPVHVEGALPDGSPAQDLEGLAHALAAHPDVRACLVRSVATWVLERVPTGQDECLLDAIGQEGRVTDLLRALVLSPAFTTVSAEAGSP